MGVLVLLTHHLTGLATLVVYYTILVLPRSRETGFLRSEAPRLLLFGAWPLYWAFTFSLTRQFYMAPILLSLTVVLGLPLAALLYAAAPMLRRGVERIGARVAAAPTPLAVVVAAAVAGVAGLAATTFVQTPGLSTATISNQVVAGLSGALPRSLAGTSGCR